MKKTVMIYSPDGKLMFQFDQGQKQSINQEAATLTSIGTVTGCTGYAVDLHWSNGTVEHYMGFPFVLVEFNGSKS